MGWRLTYSAARFRWLPQLDHFADRLVRVRWLRWMAYRDVTYFGDPLRKPPAPRLPDRPGYEPGSPEEAAYLASEDERRRRPLCYGPPTAECQEPALLHLRRRAAAHAASVRADLAAAWADDEVAQATLFPADGFAQSVRAPLPFPGDWRDGQYFEEAADDNDALRGDG